jgi:hypothetical protein
MALRGRRARVPAASLRRLRHLLASRVHEQLLQLMDGRAVDR